MEDFDPAALLALTIEGKAHLRKRVRAVRKALPTAAVKAGSAAIVASVDELLRTEGARQVALFWPIVERNEVDLRDLDRRLRERGVAVWYPAIDQETRVMTFRGGGTLEEGALEERGLGFREPPPDAPEATTLDAIVVPGLLFDGAGQRLGYGAGFYDRALARFAPPALKVGVCFHFQLSPEVPVLEHDVPVDVVVTSERTLDLRVGS